MMKNRLKSIILAIAVLAIVMVNNIGIGSFDRVDAQPNYVTDQMREFPVTQPIAQIPYTGNPDCKELMSNIRKWGRVNVQQMSNVEMPYTNNRYGGYTESSGTTSRRGLFEADGKKLLSDHIKKNSSYVNGILSIDPLRQPFDVEQAIKVSFHIDLNTAIINFKGGDLGMTCLNNKYAVVNTGNGVETLLFTKTPDPIQIN
jgi:hypothetical protein